MSEGLLNSENLLYGIQFILGLQLILIALWHFISKPTETKILLAFLCLILGLWFFKRLFSGYWEDNLLLFILIGPGKPIFVGSLLLLYYKSYTSSLKKNYVLRHLLTPTIYYTVLITFRFFNKRKSIF